MTREAIKTRLAGPLIPQKTSSQHQLQDDNTGPGLLNMDSSDTEQNDSPAKPRGCCPSRKKKRSANTNDDNDDHSKSKGARFKHWFNESVLPTCLQRRQNGEGRVTRGGPAVTERRETDIPICVRSQVPELVSKVDPITPIAPPKHTKLASNATQYTKASSAASSDDSFNEPKHASVKMTRTVIPPPPEKRAARGAILRNKTAKPVVIPRAPESEVNLGTKQSIFSIGKRKRKGALPRPQMDMYKEVIPNNLEENPVWTKPP